MPAKISPKIVGIYFGPNIRVAAFGIRTKVAESQVKSKNDQMAKSALAPVPPILVING